MFKAAHINIFMLAMDQITVCNAEGIASSNDPTENYSPTLQFPQFYRAFLHLVLVLWPTTALIQSLRSL